MLVAPILFMTDEEYLAEADELWIDRVLPCCPVRADFPTLDFGWEQFVCTRNIGHSGLHVGCGFSVIYFRWSTDYQPLPNLMLL